MSFLLRFPHDDDTVYLAHCYPYRYSDMMLDVEKLMEDPARAAFIKKETLCQVKLYPWHQQKSKLSICQKKNQQPLKVCAISDICMLSHFPIQQLNVKFLEEEKLKNSQKTIFFSRRWRATTCQS